ncbi:GLI2 [Trypoxylus dichotomus]
MFRHAEDNISLKWIFMQDNDFKHTSETAKRWFRENKVEVTNSPDVDPIENLSADIKKAVFEVSSERCQQLVDTVPCRCRTVIADKGYAMKY